jgi:predicted transcriptional regulator
VHGLRATAVVRLKRRGFSGEQISDMVGMSVAQVTNYTKFEDKKAGVRAAVAPVIEAARLEQARAKRQRAKLAIVKRLETGKARD